MRKLVLAATIAALPSSIIAAEDELAGTYRLISSTRTILETGEVLDTWGKNPNGVHHLRQGWAHARPHCQT